MLQEVSAGGVVVFGNTILLLKKFNGDWVLPKGRVKQNENIEATALREVYEESGIRAEIITYIGKVNYRYRNIKGDRIVYKTVHWYLMKTDCIRSIPQKREGFVEARFVHMDRVLDLVKYKDEKQILDRALKMIGLK
ncbi:MAG: NUDIX hydrolase [Tissierellia bacterium]|mgnify:CR=1 FL=1|nr:NUDIX hydrolase [Tissierellia bacterium]